MVITYCDICGKRIDLKYDKRFRLLGYERFGISAESDTAKLIYSGDDICERCINRINDYIADLKREDGD